MARLAGAGGALSVSLGPALAQDNLPGGRHTALLLIDARQTDPATLAMVEQPYGTRRYEVLGQEPVRAWRDGLEAAVAKAGSTHVIGRWDTVHVLDAGTGGGTPNVHPAVGAKHILPDPDHAGLTPRAHIAA